MTKMGEAGQSAIENIRIPKKIKNTKKNDLYDICITIPIVIKITPEQFVSIRPKVNGHWNFDNLFGCIELPLREELKQICDKPVDHECPDPTKSGYEKKIITYIKASKDNKKIKTWATEISKNPSKDYYVIYLDQKEFHIIVSIYYGSKLQNSN